MRKKLEPIEGKRWVFNGTFVKFGRKSGYKGRLNQTVLLVDIVDKQLDSPTNNTIVTDHLWFNYTKGFAGLELKPGDILSFEGRVETYQKGYREDDEENPIRFDYHITRPTKFCKIGRAEQDYSIYEKYNDEVKVKVEEYNENRRKAIQTWIDKQNEQDPHWIPFAKALVKPKPEPEQKRLTDFLK